VRRRSRKKRRRRRRVGDEAAWQPTDRDDAATLKVLVDRVGELLPVRLHLDTVATPRGGELEKGVLAAVEEHAGCVAVERNGHALADSIIHSCLGCGQLCRRSLLVLQHKRGGEGAVVSEGGCMASTYVSVIHHTESGRGEESLT
jgi:hypothetical protein